MYFPEPAAVSVAPIGVVRGAGLPGRRLSGTIQEVTVTNIGEVPEVGKPLIIIVPDGEPLVVELVTES